MKIIIYLPLILLFTLTFSTFNKSSLAQKENDFEVISVETANKLIEENNTNSNFIMLDVRTNEEYQEKHIANSINIDYKSPNFKDQVDKLDKDKTYLTYCRSGRRSTGASEIMESNGFKNIYMIEGGIIAWEKQGFPIQNQSEINSKYK